MASNATEPPDVVLKEINEKTDITALSKERKAKIFKAAITKLSTQQGTVGKELKHIINNLLIAYNDVNKKNAELQAKIESLNQQVNDLKKPAIPPVTQNERLWSKVHLPTTNTQQKKRDEFVVIIGNNSTESDLDLRKTVDNILYPIKKQIAITSDRVRNGKYVVALKTKEQQNIVYNKLKSDPILECSLPTKKIPTLIIREVPKEMTEEEIKNELCDNEDLNPNDITIKKILSNKNFKTNRVKVNFSKQATIEILKKQEVKIRAHCKPVEIDWGLIYCRNCGKPGHFHKDLEGKVTCKSKRPHCSHCDGEHSFEDCRHKDDRSKAKCSNCKGNHRSYSLNCPERHKLINKIKDRFIDLQ